MKSYRRRFYSF